MKRHLLFIGFVILTLSLTAQERTEKHNTNSFNQISLRINADLYYTKGNEHSIEITGDDETLDKVIVEVDGKKLIVHFSFEDRWLTSFKPERLKIKVVSPIIDGLFIQGSGNIYSEGIIETQFLELNIAGSGDIRMNEIKCERIDATISGSGDLTISGTSSSKELKINIAGSGDLKSPQLAVEGAYILIAGSGDCELEVTNYLDAKIFGSGDIKYKGEPTLKSTIAGSGRIRNIK